jgi:hypothetical protein
MRKLRFGLTAETRRQEEKPFQPERHKDSGSNKQNEIARLWLPHPFDYKIIDVVSPYSIRAPALSPIRGAFGVPRIRLCSINLTIAFVDTA